jgi:hypothetical protein
VTSATAALTSRTLGRKRSFTTLFSLFSSTSVYSFFLRTVDTSKWPRSGKPAVRH